MGVPDIPQGTSPQTDNYNVVVFSFLTNRNARQATYGNGSFILLVVYKLSQRGKQAVDRLSSHLERSVEQLLAADPSALTVGAGR